MATATSPVNPTTVEKSHIIRGKDGGEIHIVGQAPVRDGEVRFYQVFVNCLVGKRRELIPYPIHEIPLIRQLHRTFGGDVEVTAGWVPKVPQAQGMTEALMRKEIERLAGAMKAGIKHNGAYVIPFGDGHKDLFPEVYGTGAQMDLIPKMVKIYRAWVALCRQCAAENRPCTVEEIEAIVGIASPQDVAGIDFVPGLEAPPEMPQASDPSLEPSAPIHGALVGHLVKEQVPDAIAIAFAQEVGRTEPGIPLSDEQWKGIFAHGPKKSDTVTKRKALLDHLETFRGIGQPPQAP